MGRRIRSNRKLRRHDVPDNTGTPPPFDKVDVRFRNGTVVRGITPKSYRWTLGDPAYPPSYDFDIVTWQMPVGG